MQVSYCALTCEAAVLIDIHIPFDAPFVEELAGGNRATFNDAQVGQGTIILYQYAFLEVSLATQRPVSLDEKQSIEITGVFKRASFRNIH